MARPEGPRKPSPADGAEYLGHGLSFAASIALFLFLGWLLDGRLGTKPIFTIIGMFIGAGAGFYSLYHHLVVRPRSRDSDEGDGED